MAQVEMKLWKRALAYGAFALFALVIAFFLTFPYDTLAERMKGDADSAGYNLKIGGLGPGLLTVRATDILIAKKIQPGEEKPPEPMKIDSISVGPTLFPPGLGVSAKLLGGSASVKISGLSNVSLKIELDGLDVSKGNLKGFTGVDMSGVINGDVKMEIPRASVGGGAPETDVGQASGSFELGTKGLSVNGGTMSMVLPMYGSEPTPLDLPKIAFGDISAKLSFDKGAGKIDEFEGKSADLEIQATGTLKLSKRLDYSEPAIELRYKADPEFQKRLGLIGSALSMVGPDPKDPNFRMGRLTGYIGRPNFR